MSTATTTPYAAAPTLGDVLPPVKQRGRVMTFVRRHPTIVFGGMLLLSMIMIAILAPYLGTVDPTALAPAKRHAASHRSSTGSAPTCWAAMCIRG